MNVNLNVRIFASMLIALQLDVAAAAGAADASRLGKDLTPLGGEKAGNKDGSIPAWQGAEAPIDGWSYGKKRFDHWKHKGEKPLFSIDAANVDKYADRLTPGQIELIKQKKGYRMDIYPAHRTCAAPDFVAENTKKNAGSAVLAPEGWYLKEAHMPGIPFPAPKSGVEVMLNGKYAYRGVGVHQQPTITAVSPRNGGTEWIKAVDEVFWYMPWGTKGSALLSTLPPVDYYVYFSYSAPAALAGQALSATQFAQQSGNETFYYFPGQRRVRRMPSYAYDSPQIGFENQYAIDEARMLLGPLDRFDWKLVGKKEIYVPYNDFGAYNFSGKFEDWAGDSTINPATRRYEMHRVWVVEGTVKAGMRHTSPRRTYYVDEDSWNYLVAEDYDGQGKIWKVREAFPIPVYELGGSCDSPAFVQYNLSSGRYVVDLHSAGTKQDIKWHMEPNGKYFKADFYSADNLRSISER